MTSRDVLEPLGLTTHDGNENCTKPRYIVFTLNRKALLADRDNLLAMLTGMLKRLAATHPS